MLSSSFNISEFIEKVKGHSYQEIIYLADQEATKAERYYYRKCTDNCTDVRKYAVLIKDFVLFMRHGIITKEARCLDLSTFEPIRQCH